MQQSTNCIKSFEAMSLLAEDKQHMQQEMEARRQDLVAKERSLDQAEAAAERRWAKLTEDVSAKVCGALAHGRHVMASGFCIYILLRSQNDLALHKLAMAFFPLIKDGAEYHTPHQRRELPWSSVFERALCRGRGAAYKACICICNRQRRRYRG